MQDYRKLLVWQKAHTLALDTYADSAKYLRPPEAWPLRDQIRRAAISIPANIAEGTGRGQIQTSGDSSTTLWAPLTNLSMISFLRGISDSGQFRFTNSELARSRKSGACSPASLRG